jgi:hypothetical protein
MAERLEDVLAQCLRLYRLSAGVRIDQIDLTTPHDRIVTISFGAGAVRIGGDTGSSEDDGRGPDVVAAARDWRERLLRNINAEIAKSEQAKAWLASNGLLR